jgi:hypothetical protein
LVTLMRCKRGGVQLRSRAACAEVLNYGLFLCSAHPLVRRTLNSALTSVQFLLLFCSAHPLKRRTPLNSALIGAQFLVVLMQCTSSHEDPLT